MDDRADVLQVVKGQVGSHAVSLTQLKPGVEIRQRDFCCRLICSASVADQADQSDLALPLSGSQPSAGTVREKVSKCTRWVCIGGKAAETLSEGNRGQEGRQGLSQEVTSQPE